MSSSELVYGASNPDSSLEVLESTEGSTDNNIYETNGETIATVDPTEGTTETTIDDTSTEVVIIESEEQSRSLGLDQTPIITLIGYENYYIPLNGDYVELGASATSYDGQNILNVSITPETVDTSTIGTVVITYTAVDGELESSVTRTVHIIDEQSTALRIINTIDSETINASEEYFPLHDVTVNEYYLDQNIEITYTVENMEKKID